MLDSLNKIVKIPETIFCLSCFISDSFGKVVKPVLPLIFFFFNLLYAFTANILGPYAVFKQHFPTILASLFIRLYDLQFA